MKTRLDNFDSHQRIHNRMFLIVQKQMPIYSAILFCLSQSPTGSTAQELYKKFCEYAICHRIRHSFSSHRSFSTALPKLQQMELFKIDRTRIPFERIRNNRLSVGQTSGFKYTPNPLLFALVAEGKLDDFMWDYYKSKYSLADGPIYVKGTELLMS